MAGIRQGFTKNSRIRRRPRMTKMFDISHFDIITRDILNIYNFLDFYGYHHNAYDEACALLYELYWFESVG
jgi:hypothetical protein